MARDRRHELIRRLLAAAPIESHAELRRALAGRGITVTQATLSRDLRDLGVLKGPDGYRLPEDRTAEGTGLKRSPGSADAVLRRHVIGVSEANGVVVIRTTPGSAGVVALQIDRYPPPGVAGTIAGDDTVFVAVDRPRCVRSIARHVLAAAGIGGHRPREQAS